MADKTVTPSASRDRLAEIEHRAERYRLMDPMPADSHPDLLDLEHLIDKDVPALTAAVRAVLRHHDPVETTNGVKVCPPCSRAAGTAVFAPCEEVRDITDALTTQETNRA